MRVFLLHGYNVTSSQTYGALPYLLAKAGLNVEHIELGRYVALDDHVGVHQLAVGLQAALAQKINNTMENWEHPIVLPDKSEECAMITHSTGALIFRSWFLNYYSSPELIDKCPLTRVINLAPAMFGSRIAHHGRSWVNQVRQSIAGHGIGLTLLQQLELGSSLQGEIAEGFAHLDTSKMNGYIWPTIAGLYRYRLIGGLPILTALNEPGTDSVVRTTSTNPNARIWRVNSIGELHLDMHPNFITQNIDQQPVFRLSEYAHSEPFTPMHPNRGILSHLTKRTQIQRDWSNLNSGSRLLGLIQTILQTQPKDKANLFELASKISPKKPVYSQIVFSVINEHDEPVNDYNITFYRIAEKNEKKWSKLWDRIRGKMENNSPDENYDYEYFVNRTLHVHRNQNNKNRVVMYFDITGIDFSSNFGLSIAVHCNTDLYSYKTLDLRIQSVDNPQFFKPNATVLVEIKVQTQPTRQLLEFMTYDANTDSVTDSTGKQYKLPMQWDDLGKPKD